MKSRFNTGYVTLHPSAVEVLQDLEYDDISSHLQYVLHQQIQVYVRKRKQSRYLSAIHIDPWFMVTNWVDNTMPCYTGFHQPCLAGLQNSASTHPSLFLSTCIYGLLFQQNYAAD